jgi:hypothetical protein
VKRLADQPFALLGVNSDANRKALKKTLRTENLSWRSWWDAGSIDGPIQTSWQVSQRPTIYVLDKQGVIRFKDLEGDALDRAIESLLE